MNEKHMEQSSLPVWQQPNRDDDLEAGTPFEKRSIAVDEDLSDWELQRSKKIFQVAQYNCILLPAVMTFVCGCKFSSLEHGCQSRG